MRAAHAALLLLLLTACATPPPTVTPSTTEIAFPDPGRPFDATAILAAMRDSRRPGGVPTELQTDAIAGAVAGAIWTVDGEPWTTMAIGGSCGSDTCTLEVAGGRPDTTGEDAWAFSVTPATDAVTVIDARLGSVPEGVAGRADAIARASEGALLDGLILASASWLPPPDDGRIVLAYRTGDEEGSCRREVAVDTGNGTVSVTNSVDC